MYTTSTEHFILGHSTTKVFAIKVPIIKDVGHEKEMDYFLDHLL
jgi:hypothetical protein